MVSDWISEENVRPFAEILSIYAEYRFDDGDWDAIEYGLSQTEVEQDRWFEYQLIGKNTVRLFLAADIGSSVVFVRVEANPEIEVKAGVLCDVMGEYRLIR